MDATSKPCGLRFRVVSTLWLPKFDTACSLSLDRRTEDKTELVASFAQLSRAICREQFVAEGFLEWLMCYLMAGVAIKPDISASGLVEDDHEFEDGWESSLSSFHVMYPPFESHVR